MPPAILVVEKSSAIRDLISRILVRKGFAVIESGDGADGLRQFHDHENEISLAVIDMTIPAVGGLDLAAELGRQCPQLKVLYVTGCPSSIAASSINSRSPEAVLFKPFTRRMLVERVTILLRDAAGRIPWRES